MAKRLNLYKNNSENIDTIHIAFYYGEEREDSTLVVLRNKKVINEFYGQEAEKLYKYLTNLIYKG